LGSGLDSAFFYYLGGSGLTYSALGASSFFYYFFCGYGFLNWEEMYFDSCHNDEEIALLDTEFIKLIGIGGGFAFENDFLRIDFESFLVFDFGFEIEDLG
jgi:hypothetical protein